MGYFETPGSVWQLKSLEEWRCSSYFPWDHQHVTKVSHVMGWLQWFRLSRVSWCVICGCGLTSVRLMHLPGNSDMSTTSVWHLHTFCLFVLVIFRREKVVSLCISLYTRKEKSFPWSSRLLFRSFGQNWIACPPLIQLPTQTYIASI